MLRLHEKVIENQESQEYQVPRDRPQVLSWPFFTSCDNAPHPVAFARKARRVLIVAMEYDLPMMEKAVSRTTRSSLQLMAHDSLTIIHCKKTKRPSNDDVGDDGGHDATYTVDHDTVPRSGHHGGIVKVHAHVFIVETRLCDAALDFEADGSQ